MKKTKIPQIVRDLQENITAAKAETAKLRSQLVEAKRERDIESNTVGAGDVSEKALARLSAADGRIAMLQESIARREELITAADVQWRDRSDVSASMAEALDAIAEQRKDKLKIAREMMAESVRRLVLSGVDPVLANAYYILAENRPEVIEFNEDRQRFHLAQGDYDLAVQMAEQCRQKAGGANVSITLDACIGVLEQEAA